MTIRYLKETTDWSQCEFTVPQNVFIVDKGRLVGYMREDENYEWEYWFSRPLNFDKRYRTFEEIYHD